MIQRAKCRNASIGIRDGEIRQQVLAPFAFDGVVDRVEDIIRAALSFHLSV